MTGNQVPSSHSGGSFVVLDWVSRPEVFASLHGALVQGYGLDAIETEEAPAPSLQEAEGFVALATSARTSERDGVGLGREVRFHESRLLGTGLAAGEELVQLTVHSEDPSEPERLEQRSDPAPVTKAPAVMAELPSFQARITPLEGPSGPLDFEEFVKLAIAHAREGFSQVTEPDGDLAPFLLMAEKHGLGIVQWEGLDPDLFESNPALVIGSTLAPYDVSMAGLLLTVFLTGGPREPARQEALLLGILQLDDETEREATYAAAIQRTADSPPQLSEFQLIDHKLAPALADALYQGLTAELDTTAAEPPNSPQLDP